MENIDIRYLCTTIGNLAGVPIRIPVHVFMQAFFICQEQFFRHMKGFSARRRADVDHLCARLWRCDLCDKHGTDILHGKKPFLKCRQFT